MRDVLRRPGLRLLFLGRDQRTASATGCCCWSLASGSRRLTGFQRARRRRAAGDGRAERLISPVFGWVVDRFRRRELPDRGQPALRRWRSRRCCWCTIALAGVDHLRHGRRALRHLAQCLRWSLRRADQGTRTGSRCSAPPTARSAACGSCCGWSGRSPVRVCSPPSGHDSVVLIDIASFVVAAAALAGIKAGRSCVPCDTARTGCTRSGAGARHLSSSDPPVRRATIAAIAIAMLALGAVDTVIFAFVDRGPAHVRRRSSACSITVQGHRRDRRRCCSHPRRWRGSASRR